MADYQVINLNQIYTVENIAAPVFMKSNKQIVLF